MNRAKRKITRPGEKPIIWAGDFDPIKEEQRPAEERIYVCPHIRCTKEPEVYHRERANLLGSAFGRINHFATKPGQRKLHDETCPFVSEESDKDTKIETLAEALAEGKKFLLHLNIDAKKSSRRGSSTARDGNSPYAKWCRENTVDGERRFHTISITSIDKYFDVLDKLVQLGGDNVTERMTMAYREQVMAQPEFHIGNDPEKLKELYNNLSGFGQDAIEKTPGRVASGVVFSKAGRAVRGRARTYHHGFPRLFTFVPSQNARTRADRNGPLKGPIKGTGIFMESNGQSRFLLQNQLHIHGEDPDGDKRSVLTGSATHVLATPSIEKNTTSDVIRKFRTQAAAGTLWTHINWSVFSNEQFTVVPPEIHQEEPERQPVAQEEQPKEKPPARQLSLFDTPRPKQ